MYLRKLENQLTNALNGEISLFEFTEWYEEWFEIHSEMLRSNPGIFVELENLFADIGYYEPNEALRSDHNSYFGNEVFVTILQKILRQLNASNSQI